MIDYLELLLKRQEQEEPGDALEWKQNASAVPWRTADGYKASGAAAGDGPELPTQAAEAAAWMTGTASLKVPDVQAGPKTMSGGTDASEAAGFDIYEAADAEAIWKPAETGSAAALFRAREAALPGGAAGMTLSGEAAGTASLRVPGVQVGPKTMSGGTDAGEAAGFDIYEAADAEAMWKQTETGSAAALFRVRETTLPAGTGGTALSGAPGLYRQMTQTGRAVGGLRFSTRLLTVMEGTSASPGLGAEELDELFSRDARRYDGGFSLF